MAEKRLAVISVSASAGHVRAADSLAAWSAIAYPDVEVTHVDLMRLVSPLFRRAYAQSYLKIIRRHPRVWGYLYDWSDRKHSRHMVTRLRTSLENPSTRRLRKRLEALNPDQVICTHFLPAQLLSRLVRKKRWSKPVWVQVTDFDVHMFWVHEHMTGYFAGSDEVAHRMRTRGLEPGRVHVTGIPIMPVFSQKLDRETCVSELHLDSSRPAALLMGGGLGMSDLAQLAERLARTVPALQLVAIAGRNRRLYRKLRDVADRHPGRVFPLGFTTVIERVMAACDFAVTKPGGLTTSECLAMNLPMILIAPIPGQEERNAEFLLENGVALAAHDLVGVEFRAKRLLEQPERLVRLRRAAAEIARPEAALAVLEHVLGRSALREPASPSP